MDTLIAILTATEGHEDELLQELLGLVPPTAAEPGAVDYQVHRGDAGSRTVIVYERYADETAMDVHLGQKYLKDALQRCGRLLARAPELTRCTRVDGFPSRIAAR